MAAVEHQCETCGHVWFDNWLFADCPQCGGMATSDYDEQEDDHA